MRSERKDYSVDVAMDVRKLVGERIRGPPSEPKACTTTSSSSCSYSSVWTSWKGGEHDAYWLFSSFSWILLL